MEKQSRSLLAILSTDIPSYTQITEEDESYAFTLLAKHRDIIKKYVSTSNGFTFKEMGDGTFNKFDSAIDASRCAIKIQNEALEHMQIAVDIWKDADERFSIAQDAKKQLEEWSK
jgi:adenylate cyclase